MRRINESRKHKSPALVFACALAAPCVQAVELDTGNSDWSLRFDNTIKLSTIYRTRNADPRLANALGSNFEPTGLGQNAGDDNFRKRGFVSERVDLLSEFDAVYKRDFGFRIGAAGWYDRALHGRSDAIDPLNGQMPPDAFYDYTKREAGRKAELLDAFVFGGWDLGSGRRVTARLGQHALQWGESLFFGENAVARAQGPVDIYKLLATPNAQFKEIIRPVPQVSTQVQLSPQLSVGGYYQFKWEEDRLAPAGSYFSQSNFVWGGSPYSQSVQLGPGAAYSLVSSGDRKPKNSGQFGLQMKLRVDDTDLGFYYAQFRPKSGQLYGRLGSGAPDANGNLPGEWYYGFQNLVKVLGTSASRSFGDLNLSVEASVRDKMPLRSSEMLYGFFPGQPEPRAATGKTAHVNVSWLATFGPSFIAKEASMIGEVAWNRVLSRNDPDQTLDSGRTRDATAIQMIYTPSYRQVASGLDLNVPIGVRYILDGRSSVMSWDAKGTGSLTMGLDATYLQVWQISLNYTHNIGSKTPYIDFSPSVGTNPNYGWGNSLGDRNYVSLSVRRTF